MTSWLKDCGFFLRLSKAVWKLWFLALFWRQSALEKWVWYMWWNWVCGASASGSWLTENGGDCNICFMVTMLSHTVLFTVEICWIRHWWVFKNHTKPMSSIWHFAISKYGPHSIAAWSPSHWRNGSINNSLASSLIDAAARHFSTNTQTSGSYNSQEWLASFPAWYQRNTCTPSFQHMPCVATPLLHMEVYTEMSNTYENRENSSAEVVEKCEQNKQHTRITDVTL